MGKESTEDALPCVRMRYERHYEGHRQMQRATMRQLCGRKGFMEAEGQPPQEVATVTDVAPYPRTVLSLCSGVGMLDAGLTIATGAVPVCFCEREAFAASVLVARMADKAMGAAPVWDDLTTFDGEPWRGVVDCITAGFPCQPWSVAGAGRGTADDRWIWPDIVRIIGEVRPSTVFLENTPGLLQGGKGQPESGAELCISDLATLGFDAAWGVFSAEAVGASHLRKRVFIVAHAENPNGRCGGEAEQSIAWEWGRRFTDGSGGVANATSQRWGEARRCVPSAANGVTGAGATMGYATGARRDWNGQEREECHQSPARSTVPTAGIAAMGHAAGGGFRELWESPQRTGLVNRNGESMAYAKQPRRQGRGGRCGEPQGRQEPGSGSVAKLRGAHLPVFAPGPSDPAWPSVIATLPELAPATASATAPATAPAESCIRGMADGVAPALDSGGRADRLRAIGNGVVPLCAAVAFTVLWRRLHGELPD